MFVQFCQKKLSEQIDENPLLRWNMSEYITESRTVKYEKEKQEFYKQQMQEDEIVQDFEALYYYNYVNVYKTAFPLPRDRRSNSLGAPRCRSA